MTLIDQQFPSIPSKRYFTISETSGLCEVKPHVLRYWEQEFSQLKPIKRKGNRRYYQRHDVLLIRQIKELLYDNGYTILGAKQKLNEDESSKQLKKSELKEIETDIIDLIDILD
ncbi:MAG: transcriptional regulator [Gammaproteobacteria bacterium]|nr:transcriptional regulator [Gammaproteobacteria bacterium]|tara:strand:- start:381 stop:722 length:342 start_codon:yes stop_codon:yes gene_type:complete